MKIHLLPLIIGVFYAAQVSSKCLFAAKPPPSSPDDSPQGVILLADYAAGEPESPFVSNNILHVTRKACPHLLTEDGQLGKLCCPSGFLLYLSATYFSRILELFHSSPTCVENLNRLFCDSSCGLDQDRYVLVTEKLPIKAEAITIVREANIYLGQVYAQSLFNSCAHTFIPSSGRTVMQFICESSKHASLCEQDLTEFFNALQSDMSDDVNVLKFHVALKFDESHPKPKSKQIAGYKGHVRQCNESNKLIAASTDRQTHFGFPSSCANCKSSSECKKVGEIGGITLVEKTDQRNIILYPSMVFAACLMSVWLGLTVWSLSGYFSSAVRTKSDVISSDEAVAFILPIKHNNGNQKSHIFMSDYDIVKGKTTKFLSGTFFALTFCFFGAIATYAYLYFGKLPLKEAAAFLSVKSEAHLNAELFRQLFRNDQVLREVQLIVSSRTPLSTDSTRAQFLTEVAELQQKMFKLRTANSDFDSICYQPYSHVRKCYISSYLNYLNGASSLITSENAATMGRCARNSANISCLSPTPAPDITYPWHVVAGYEGNSFSRYQHLVITLALKEAPKSKNNVVLWENKLGALLQSNYSLEAAFTRESTAYVSSYFSEESLNTAVIDELREKSIAFNVLLMVAARIIIATVRLVPLALGAFHLATFQPNEADKDGNPLPLKVKYGGGVVSAFGHMVIPAFQMSILLGLLPYRCTLLEFLTLFVEAHHAWQHLIFAATGMLSEKSSESQEQTEVPVLSRQQSGYSDFPTQMMGNRKEPVNITSLAIFAPINIESGLIICLQFCLVTPGIYFDFNAPYTSLVCCTTAAILVLSCWSSVAVNSGYTMLFYEESDRFMSRITEKINPFKILPDTKYSKIADIVKFPFMCLMFAPIVFNAYWIANYDFKTSNIPLQMLKKDSSIHRFFTDSLELRAIGDPVYFVVEPRNQTIWASVDRLCSSPGCQADSLLNRLKMLSFNENSSIAAVETSPIDGFITWYRTCCYIYKNGSYCDRKDSWRGGKQVCKLCAEARDEVYLTDAFPATDDFEHFFEIYLNQPSNEFCPFGAPSSFKNLVFFGPEREIKALLIEAYYKPSLTTRSRMSSIDEANYLADHVYGKYYKITVHSTRYLLHSFPWSHYIHGYLVLTGIILSVTFLYFMLASQQPRALKTIAMSTFYAFAIFTVTLSSFAAFLVAAILTDASVNVITATHALVCVLLTFRLCYAILFEHFVFSGTNISKRWLMHLPLLVVVIVLIFATRADMWLIFTATLVIPIFYGILMTDFLISLTTRRRREVAAPFQGVEMATKKLDPNLDEIHSIFDLIASKNQEGLRALLSQKSKSHLINVQCHCKRYESCFGDSPLIAAVKAKDVGIAKLLYELGASLDIERNEAGHSAKMIITTAGDGEMCEWLQSLIVPAEPSPRRPRKDSALMSNPDEIERHRTALEGVINGKWRAHWQKSLLLKSSVSTKNAIRKVLNAIEMEAVNSQVWNKRGSC